MNLKALSEKLGLSQTTVSRALNGYPEVGRKTRERVLKMAEELNYRPNRFAKSLATGKTGHIGLIYPVEHNLITPLFSEFLGGITQRLVESGLDFSIMPTTAASEVETYRSVVDSGRVDGLIVSSPLYNDPRISYLCGTRMPFVVHGRTGDIDQDGSNLHEILTPRKDESRYANFHSNHAADAESDTPFSYLDVDNRDAFYKATRLLLNMGHRHIALINGNHDFTFALHRFQGYQQALQQADLPLEQESIFSLQHMTEINGYQAATAALSSSNPPTAFIASSIILALGIRRAIRDKNQVIGRDVSVITYDDGLPYLDSSKFNPALTTVYSSIRQAGYQITDHLYQIISTRGEYEVRKVLDVDLIVRDSTNAVSG